MATNRELKKTLLAKLGVTPQRLSQLAGERKRELPMSTAHAVYTIAHEHGIDILKYLGKDETLEVRSLVADLRSGAPPSVPAAPRTQPKRRRPSTGSEIALGKIRIPGGLLSERHRKDAEQMAINVYPLLYAFENSVREFIDGHLTAAYGGNWYGDPKLVSTDVRKTVERNRNADAQNPTHSARNARPIYYTTFGELVLIVQSENGGKVFKRPLFPRVTWFPELVKASEHTRNIVAHMNPIKQQDLKRLQVDFEDWLNQTKDHLPPTVPTQ